MSKIPVGISSCLLGEAVRFDGGHKHHSYITATLGQYFEFHPCCPEVEIGLGVPRPALRLVQTATGGVRCQGVKDTTIDVTERLKQQAQQHQNRHTKLCGYILKKDSPSCGMERVRVYRNEHPERRGSGIYASVMMQNNPLLPVEEEGRLGDPGLRENFIQRVYTLYRWRLLLQEGLNVSALTCFHARHKLMIMSHGDYRPLGQLLANVSDEELKTVAERYIRLLMAILKKPTSRTQHVNVLQHIQGYLKKVLSADDKAELCELIERYRTGEIPLIVPLTLLKHHFRKAPNPYIDQSWYLSPCPPALQT